MNARHIYSKDPETSKVFPPLIMLAMEDVTGIMTIAATLAEHTSQLEKTLAQRTKVMESKIEALERQFKKVTKK